MTLFGSFDRPIGAAADARELEYIASLHQTRPNGRVEGTISATDIVAFVRSRSGLKISHDRARDVVRGLGGGDVSDAALRRLYGEQSLDDNNNNDKSSRELDDELIKQELGGSVNQKLSVKLKDHLARRKNEIIMEDTGGGNEMDGSANNSLLPVSSLRSDDELQPNEGSAAAPRDRQQNKRSTGSKSADEEKYKEEYLDLVQLLSILFIPVFARASYDRDHDVATAGNQSRQTLTGMSISNEKKFSQEDVTVNPLADAFDTTINTAAEAVNTVKDAAGEAVNVVTTAVGINKEEVQTAFEMEQWKKFEEMKVKPERLIGHVLSLLLKSIKAEEESELDKELVKQLLIAHSEFERAEDDELLEEMVNMAKGPVANAKMNLDAFFRALTSDIKAYDSVCESRVTTTIFDVFGFESFVQIRKDTEDGAGNEPDEENTPNEVANSSRTSNRCDVSLSSELVWKPMSASIDLVLDTHRSVSFTVSLWVFYIFLVVTYTIPLTAQGLVDSVTCEAPFGCNLGSKMIKWLGYAVFFVIAGFIVVYPIQLGNDPTSRNTRKQILGIALILMYAVVPYVAVALYQKYQFSVDEYSALDSLAMESGMLICLISGGVLFIISLLLLISNRIGSKRIRDNARASKWLTPHNVRAESDVKRAANHKIKRMILNASSLHPNLSTSDTIADGEDVVVRRSAKDEAVLNFILRGDKVEDKCGGFLWVWKKIWNRSLYEEEGIWIHTRLLVGQTGQLMVIVFLGFLLFVGTQYIAAAADTAREQLESTGEIVDLPLWLYDFVPTGQQVYQTFIPGAVTALIVAICIFILYIPSTTATILRFRTGMLPSLRDPLFQRYKVGVDSVFFNASNMIWALFGAALLFALLVTGLLFLILWPFTRDLVVLAAAWILGLFLTILLKTISLKLVRKNFFSAFYRMKPSGANRSTLAFECWQIGLGGGVLISRLIQFILAAFFYIGRIDLPFLSEHVSFLGYRFDLVPTHFQKDILVHEAHRHPYLERLHAMYLMRLRHKEGFSCRAGACWRQLFVLALMPWLSKYRIFQHKRDADAVEDYEFMMRMKRINKDASV